MDTYRDPSEQQIGDLQKELRTTLEQVKALENIILSGEIKLDEADQVWELYIIKLKCDICIFETNVNNFSERKKAHVDLKIATKGYYIKEEIKYNAIRIISVQTRHLRAMRKI